MDKPDEMMRYARVVLQNGSAEWQDVAQLCCYVRQLYETNTVLLAACEAAIAYDVAIQQEAVKGQSWVEGEGLDALYEKWITLARAALKKAKGTT